MKRILLCIILLCLPRSGHSQTLAESFEAAQQAPHEQALALYFKLIEEHGQSAPILYNLANSYALKGQTGFAVLYYERALQLAPGDADIQANLEQVRKDAGLYRDQQALYEHIALLLGPNQWLVLSLLGFVLLSLTVLAAALRPQSSLPHFRLCLILFITLILLPLPAAFLGYQTWQQGVIIADDARLLLSPFAESSPLGSIQAGRLVRPGQEHGNYVFVQDETGRSGWLERKHFQLLLERVP